MFFFFPFACLVFFSSFSGAAIENEGDLHFGFAKNHYKNKNIVEASRILKEIVFYYDTENLSAYRLLIRIYREQGDKENAARLEDLYVKVKVAKEARAAGKKVKLAPLEALQKGLPQEKIEACRILGEQRDEKAIPYLVEALSDPYYNFYLGVFEVRKAASESLVLFGESAFPHLVKAADSADGETRWSAVLTLSNQRFQEPLRSRAAGVFVRSLKDPYSKVRMVAVKGAAENDLKDAIPDITALCGDADAEVRYMAVVALGGLCRGGETCTPSVEALAKLLDDKDKKVANEAIRSLVSIGDEKEITPRLLEIAGNEKRETITRWYAIKGLGGLLSGRGIEQIEKILESDNFWLKSAAAVALGRSAPEDSSGSAAALYQKSSKVYDDTMLKLTLSSPVVYEEARLNGIERALGYLASQQLPDGSLQSFYPLGTTQLAMLCFQKHGYPQGHPFIKKGMEYMLLQKRDDGSFYSDVRSENEEPGNNKIVFTTSLAIRILAAAGSPEYEPVIRNAMKWIQSIQNPDGGFGYFKGSRSDITATIFAVSGLVAAYDYLGLPKTDEAWIKTQDYVTGMQNEDGGFGYNKEECPDSYGSATASGIMALHYCGAGEKLTGKAVDWTAAHYGWESNPLDPNPRHYQYYVQELAAAYHLTGRETIKDKNGVVHHWFSEVSRKLLNEQDKGGWWVSDKEPLFTTYLVGVLQLEKASAALEGM